MRLLHTKLVEEGKLFEEDKIRIEQMQGSVFDQMKETDSDRMQINSYSDLIALYLNKKQNDYDPKDINDFMELTRKILKLPPRIDADTINRLHKNMSMEEFKKQEREEIKFRNTRIYQGALKDDPLEEVMNKSVTRSASRSKNQSPDQE